MTKKNLAVIGGGVISGHYLAALNNNPTYQLVAMCDINTQCVSRELYQDVPFYNDHKIMLEDIDIDTAIIATPPASHFNLACELLQSGVNVLMEKPMCTNDEDIAYLYDLAKQVGKEVICLFHWRYADEVIFLKEYLQSRNIQKITTRICDNYCVPGTLQMKPECRNLMGAWYDSGVNALSYIDLLIGLEQAELTSAESIADSESGFPVYAKKEYLCQDTTLEIGVDWRYDTRKKTSVITLEDEELLISHTDQTVVSGGKLLFSAPAEKRLESHYLNLFHCKSFQEDNEDITKKIHKILFRENVI